MIANKFWIAAAANCLLVAGTFAQTPASAPAAAANSGLSNGTTLQAELTKSVDAKKAKTGDEVTAKVTQDVKADGKVVVSKGSKLVGHITEAQAKSKDGESKLGVVFEKAVLKGGQEVAFNGVIVSFVAPADQGPSTALGGNNMDRGAVPTAARGQGVTATAYGGAAPMPDAQGRAQAASDSAAGKNSGTSATGNGLVGMEGVGMTATASGAIFHSSTKNIKLDSGSQMVLQVASK